MSARRNALLVAAGIALVAVLLAGRLRRAPAPPSPPAFALQGTDGHPVSLADFRGHPVLVFFGYTRCRSACTEPLAGMKAAVAERPGTRALFVTLDPARDDAARLAAFVAPFSPPVEALTGSPDAIAAAERAFGVYAVPHQEADTTHFDRSNLIYAVGPTGKLIGHVDGGAPAAVIADTIGKPAAGETTTR